jgi:glycerophosphoryl diester phosphodiesterase
MLSIGHRGCGGQYPENTIRAITASAHHVDAVEIDLMRCGSGELVLFHDEDLERVTGRDGELEDTPWEHLRELRVAGSEEPVPRFEAALDAWPDGLVMNLDIHKSGIAPEALSAVTDLDEWVILSSTNETVLQEARAAPASVARGLSFYRNPETNIQREVDLGCEFIHVDYDLCLETDLVDRAHEAGLKIDAWTVDEASEIPPLREIGVDAMTVDRWDIL